MGTGTVIRPAILESLEKELDLFMRNPHNKFTFRISDLYNLFRNQHELSVALINLEAQGKVVKWTKAPVSYFHTHHQEPRAPPYYNHRQHKYTIVFDDEVKQLMNDRETAKTSSKPPRPPNPAMVKVLKYLEDNAARFNSTEVGKATNISYQNALYHLRKLERQSVLDSRKEGLKVVFWHVKHTEQLK